MYNQINRKMNTISFDNNRNCTVHIPANSIGISFLLNPLFANTTESLKKDISNCQDNGIKLKLERFLKDIEDGKFHFMVDTWWNIPTHIECITAANNDNDIEITADDRNSGGWMTTIHNVYAEHTGFWYAAINIPAEIQAIKEHIHILQGYMVFAENIDELILLIKQSDCRENILKELLNRGLSNKQAQAIFDFKLTHLAFLQKDQLTAKINDYNALIEILKEYV